MEYFINKDGKILAYTHSNGCISLYDKEQCILSRKTNLKNVSDAHLMPIYYNHHLMLFEYRKGIEIMSEKGSQLLKVGAVYTAEIFDNILLAISNNKKMFAIDYLKCEIVAQYNISENFDFCKVEDNLLLYRIKRNKSFLYNTKTKQLIELKGLPILDGLILKFTITKQIIHIFYSGGSFEDDNCVIEYDMNTNQYIKKDFNSFAWANGAKFIDYFNPKVDENIEIVNNDGYVKLINSLKNKYGLFMAFYLVDENKLLNLKTPEATDLKKYFMEYKSIISKYNLIKSFDDFANLKVDLRALEMRMNKDK